MENILTGGSVAGGLLVLLLSGFTAIVLFMLLVQLVFWLFDRWK